MSGASWGKWFWSDWRSDPALRACSPAARGVWMDMLCIMAEADGYLLIAGRPPSTELLARVICSAAHDVAAAVAELEEHAVFSRAKNKVIYSRRMVRDEKRRRIGRETGPMAQAVSVGAESENSATPQGPPGKPEPDTTSQKPEAATPSATQPLRGLDDWPDVPPGQMVACFAAAVGSPWLDPSKIVTPKFHAQAPGYLSRWRAEGCSWLADVLPVAAAMAPGADGPIQSLKFFDGAILSAHAARTAPIDTSKRHRGGDHDDKFERKQANLRRSIAGSERLAAFVRDHPGGGLGDH